MATALLMLWTTTAASGRTYEPEVTFRGRAIPMLQVPTLHCHDSVSGNIRCFRTSQARDRDVLRSAENAFVGQSASPVVFYVTWYWDENYGSYSFSASQPYPNLGALGWNDAITSFKSLNGGHPRWWVDNDYTGRWWLWRAGAWVPNVGSGANDTFSSVMNT